MNTFQKYKKYFKSVLLKQFPNDYRSLLESMEKDFNLLLPDLQFVRHSKNPMDRRIPLCALFLSLVKVLDKRGETYEKIRIVCLEVAKGYVTPKNILTKKLKNLQGWLATTAIFRAMARHLAKKINHRSHPDGFSVRLITNPAETFGLGYGIDILECGICKLFTKHHAGQYSKILCEIDYLTSSLAGLELIRSGTIANGASVCDFRFRKK